MFLTLLQVALGGGIGSALRFAIGIGLVRIAGPGFPFAILTVNVVGSFLMGVVVVYAEQRSILHLSPFVTAGILGGFTTFSAFSLEAYTLFERGETAQALIYVTASVVLSIGALVAGVFLARSVLA